MTENPYFHTGQAVCSSMTTLLHNLNRQLDQIHAEFRDGKLTMFPSSAQELGIAQSHIHKALQHASNALVAEITGKEYDGTNSTLDLITRFDRDLLRIQKMACKVLKSEPDEKPCSETGCRAITYKHTYSCPFVAVNEALREIARREQIYPW